MAENSVSRKEHHAWSKRYHHSAHVSEIAGEYPGIYAGWDDTDYEYAYSRKDGGCLQQLNRYLARQVVVVQVANL